MHPTPSITVADRMLAMRLGLGDLIVPSPCMKYQNACVCAECVTRAETPAPVRVRQPWELPRAA